jgi:hypothetical protein
VHVNPPSKFDAGVTKKVRNRFDGNDPALAGWSREYAEGVLFVNWKVFWLKGWGTSPKNNRSNRSFRGSTK